jgi:hypothetical protein
MRMKDRMRLYRHSSLCSTAMQLFLDHNPDYWCLVPMKSNDADRDDQAMTSSMHDVICLSGTSVRNDGEVQAFSSNVPASMTGYRFSIRQKNEQRHFFTNKLDLIHPSMDFDLYHAAIAIVCK